MAGVAVRHRGFNRHKVSGGATFGGGAPYFEAPAANSQCQQQALHQ